MSKITLLFIVNEHCLYKTSMKTKNVQIRGSERETGYEKEAADPACFSVTRTRRRWG